MTIPSFSTQSVFDSTMNFDPPVDESSILATVDPAYTGVGNPKVIFDSDGVLSEKTYVYLGLAPGPGDRVVMHPLGDSWVIVGVIGGSTGYVKGIQIYNAEKASDNLTTFNPGTPYELCRTTIPYLGWNYRLAACATAFYQGDGNATPVPQWDLVVLNEASLAISKYGVQPVGQYQVISGWHVGATVYTGTQIVRQILVRSSGSAGLQSVRGYRNTGMMIMQIPA